MSFDFDVIVIGGGPCGLAAARVLAEAKAKVCVVEARDRVGGRTYTVEQTFPSAHKVYTDRGGAYVGVKQTSVLALAKELGISTLTVPTKGKNVVEINGVVGEYSGTIPPLSVASLLDLQLMITRIDKAARQIDPLEPWKSPGAAALDSMTTETYLNSLCWTQTAAEEMRLAWRVITCAEVSDTSALQMLHYIRTAEGITQLIETTGGAQEMKLQGGCQQLSIGLKAKVEAAGGRVLLSSPVRRIEYSHTGATVYIEVPASSSSSSSSASSPVTLKGRRIIMAMGAALCSRIVFSPPLPPLRQQFMSRSFMGSIIKTTTYYRADDKRAPWESSGGFSGQLVSDIGPVSASYAEPYKENGDVFGIMGFVLARHAHEWRQKTKSERQAAVCQQYARQWKLPAMLHPLHYDEQDWDAEEFSRGCYASMCAPGALSQFGPSIRAPVGVVHWSGTELSTLWAGYIEGALRHGESTARGLLSQLKS